MGWDGLGDILNDAVMEHLSEIIILNPDQESSREVSALVDIEGVNADVIGGTVSGVVGRVQFRLSDSIEVDKGSFVTYQGERYVVVDHPRKVDSSMCEFEIGVIGEQSIPDIRY